MKRFLFVLTAVSAISFALPTLAAPKVISKQKIAPPIPLLALPKDARNSVQQLIKELKCGDITYRYYLLVTQYSDQHYQSKGYAVAEAIKRSSVKRFIQTYHVSKVPGAASLNDMLAAPLTCDGTDLYVMAQTYNGAQGQLSETLLRIPYTSFTRASAWRIQQGITRTYLIDSGMAIDPVIGEDVVQMPGSLKVDISGIHGDSRPGTISANGTITLHTLPQYRNLGEITKRGYEFLQITFYRFPDGYGVKEVTVPLIITTSTPALYYRIHDGESSYTQVDSLPITSFDQSAYLNRATYGLTLLDKDRKEVVLIHGLPYFTSETISTINVTGSVISETATTYNVRYQIRDIKSGHIQYWQVVIQK